MALKVKVPSMYTEFDPQLLHGGRREPALPLLFWPPHAHACPHMCVHTEEKNEGRRGMREEERGIRE